MSSLAKPEKFELPNALPSMNADGFLKKIFSRKNQLSSSLSPEDQTGKIIDVGQEIGEQIRLLMILLKSSEGSGEKESKRASLVTKKKNRHIALWENVSVDMNFMTDEVIKKRFWKSLDDPKNFFYRSSLLAMFNKSDCSLEQLTIDEKELEQKPEDDFPSFKSDPFQIKERALSVVRFDNQDVLDFLRNGQSSTMRRGVFAILMRLKDGINELHAAHVSGKLE